MKKIYLIQFRTDQSERHEQQCFRESLAGLNLELTFFNAVKDDPGRLNLAQTAGVILGGSGQFYLSRKDGENDWQPRVFFFLDSVLARDIPLLGICFGFQLLAKHQGAEIRNLPEMAETGTLEMFLLPAVQKDEIFSQLPQNFLAQVGHKDSAVNLPSRMTPLVRSERIPCQAFRVAGQKAWGVLFHPELNCAKMKERLLLFPNYADGIVNLDEFAVREFKDTPEAEKVLKLFFSAVISPNLTILIC